ncbi:hypothetical protein ACFLZZ_04810 [Nanoarchaeota archaeon]
MFKPNKKLWDRVGDYTLIGKKNYSFDEGEVNDGVHGGVSKEEMFVPLIVIKK